MVSDESQGSMGEIVEPTKGRQVSKSISFQDMQELYRELLGNNENANHHYFAAHIIRVDDIEHLHNCIQETVAPFVSAPLDCKVSASYSNGTTEGFGSFELFKLKGLNRPTATRFIDLEYDFLVRIKTTGETRAYKLGIALRSKQGEVDHLKKINASESELNLFYSYNTSTSNVRISYVDMAMQRNLKAQVDEWYGALKVQHNSKYLQAITKYEDAIIAVLRSLMVLLTAIAFAKFVDLNTVQINANSYFLAMAVVFVSYIASIPIMKAATENISRSEPLSAVILGPTDEQLLTSSQSNSSARTLRILRDFTLSVAASVFAAFLVARYFIT